MTVIELTIIKRLLVKEISESSCTGQTPAPDPKSFSVSL